jgi:hypothetical protein
MRATISAGLILFVFGCGGRTLLDDPDDELPLGHTSQEPDGGASTTTENDAGSTKASDSGGGSSSGGSTVSCGTATCKSATQDCCTTMSGMAVAASCVTKGSCTMGVVAACTSASDCSSGDVCCASLGTGGTTGGGTTTGGGLGGFSLSDIAVKCEKTCGTGGFQLCKSSTECSKGVTCQASGFGPELCGGLGALTSELGGLGGATGTGIPGH